MKTMMLIPAAACLIAASCATDNSGGRVPLSESTRGEDPAAGVPLFTLTEFADSAATQLISELKDIPEVKGSGAPGRAAIIFGDINNQTQGVVPTSDFQAFRARLRQKLQNSTRARTDIMFQESRSSFEALRDRERPIGRETSTREPTFDGDRVFLLNGDFYRMSRGSTSQYQMSFRLIRYSDGVQVWESLPYDNAKFESRGR